jgi:transposase InsO family protein
VPASTEEVTKAELARRLGVSRGSLYYRHKIPEKDEELRRRIEAVMLEHPGYGHRRVADALGISRERARRVMHKFHLKPARRARAPRKPLDQGRPPELHPDITAVLCPCAPHVVWVSDFTYIAYRGEFLYLATILDLFTGEVLAAQVMTTHSAELILRTLIAAILRTGCIPDWLHSDQGSEYISAQVRELLRLLEIKISMAPKKSPWRNGSQESFFGRFKVEFGDPERFDETDQLIAALYEHVAYFSNLRIKNRLHMPPAEFKKRWLIEHPGFKPRMLNPGQIDLLRRKLTAAFAL